MLYVGSDDSTVFEDFHQKFKQFQVIGMKPEGRSVTGYKAKVDINLLRDFFKMTNSEFLVCRWCEIKIKLGVQSFAYICTFF